jgi:hypothetical protein
MRSHFAILDLVLSIMVSVCLAPAQTIEPGGQNAMMDAVPTQDATLDAVSDTPSNGSGSQVPIGQDAWSSSRPGSGGQDFSSADAEFSLPSASENFHHFLQHSGSPVSLLKMSFDAGSAEFRKQQPDYGFGFHGFVRRYGSLLADSRANSFFGTFLFPSLLHQEDHYFRLGPESSPWRRATHALKQVMIAHGRDGDDVFNSSLMLTTILSKSLENAYYPQDQRDFARTIDRVGLSVLDRAQANVSAEFLPDIERFCWQHMPRRLKRFEKRIPFSSQWEPPAFSEKNP